MDMPKLIPILIKTKDELIWIRIWRWITSVRKWEVTEDWEYKLPDDEPVIVIPKGFIFDGASVPRPLWILLSPTGLLLIPGLIHDFAYRYDYLWALGSSGTAYKYKEKSGRSFWDSMFRRVGLDVNGMAFIDLIARGALFLFGWIPWMFNRRLNEPEIKPNKEK